MPGRIVEAAARKTEAAIEPARLTRATSDGVFGCGLGTGYESVADRLI